MTALVEMPLEAGGAILVEGDEFDGPTTPGSGVGAIVGEANFQVAVTWRPGEAAAA